MEKIENGVWSISEATGEAMGSENGFTRTAMHLGGFPPVRARNQVIAATLRRSCNAWDGLPEGAKTDSAKVTITGIDRIGNVSAMEGRAIRHQDRPMLQKKGSNTRGWWLDQLDVIDSVAGYNGQLVLAEHWNRSAELVPELVKVDLTGKGIPEMTQDDPESPPLTAGYFFTHPGFGDGPTHGCVFVATDKQTGDQPELGQGYSENETIVNGYFWCPPGASIEREHGSFTLGQLGKWGGQIRDFGTTLTFRDFVVGTTPVMAIDLYRALTRVPARVA